MVVLFPGTKDQGWRWQTSNNEYGKFHLSLSREALGARCRTDGLHSECNRKCEQLARQLCELKSELDRLRVGSRCASPIEREGCRDPPHHNGDCLFSDKARMPCDDMFHTTHDIEYNGGRRTEPQVLEDHLRADHPRLVKRVQPLNHAGASSFDVIAEHGGAQRDKGSVQIHSAPPGTVHSDDKVNMYRRNESPGSGGFGSGQQMVAGVGEYQGDSGGPTSPQGGKAEGAGYFDSRPIRKTPTPRFPHKKGGSGGSSGGGGTGGGPREQILPPSQRYNFYRYYGFAGQGAKTSRGWNPK